MKIATDKVKHFLACAAISFTASTVEFGAEYHNAWIAGFIAGMAIGVGKEYGDSCAHGNKWDWSDIGADVVGSIIGATLGSMFTLFK
jgi:uncharacterized protein YfiM (DUF2279 family)